MYRIECWDCTERMERIRVTPASIRSTGRACLRASSSTERSRDGWLVRPLSRVGRFGLPGEIADRPTPCSHRFARRFGAERGDEAVDEINSSRASDARHRADNSAVSADKQYDM